MLKYLNNVHSCIQRSAVKENAAYVYPTLYTGLVVKKQCCLKMREPCHEAPEQPLSQIILQFTCMNKK